MYSSVWYPVTYRWRTDGVQMTFRWHTDEIQLTCLKCMKVLSIKSVESILSAFTWHKLYLFMRLSSEMLWGSYFCFKSFGWVIVGDWLFDDTYNLVLLCKSPFVFRKSLNEWLLVIGWWNKGDLNPWPPNTLVVAVSGLMMVGVGLLVIRFNWGWDQLFEETSWRPSSDGPGVGRGCQGIMIRIQ